MVDTQFQVRVKKIKIDNAFELGSSGNLKIFFFADKGIIHQTTCSYTPTTKWGCGMET